MESQTGMRALGFAKRISGKQPRFRYFTTMPGNHASNRIHPEAIDGKQGVHLALTKHFANFIVKLRPFSLNREPSEIQPSIAAGLGKCAFLRESGAKIGNCLIPSSVERVNLRPLGVSARKLSGLREFRYEQIQQNKGWFSKARFPGTDKMPCLNAKILSLPAFAGAAMMRPEIILVLGRPRHFAEPVGHDFG
jgi:hypothetical protein